MGKYHFMVEKQFNNFDEMSGVPFIPWLKAWLTSSGCKILFQVANWSNFIGNISCTRLLWLGLLILKSLNSFPLI